MELVKAAPRGQQRLLEYVLGVLRGAEDPVAVQLKLAPVGVGQLAKRRTGGFADRLNSLPKYAVSATLKDPVWNNSTILKGPDYRGLCESG